MDSLAASASISENTNNHIPVLLDDIEDFIVKELVEDKKQNQIDTPYFYDGTFGGGGYTEVFAKYGHVVAVDMDFNAIKRGEERFKSQIESGVLQLLHNRFDIGLKEFEDSSFDYIVADLGFSTNQLDYSDRGFSYQHVEEILDLRYDATAGLPCYQKLYHLKTVDNLRKTIYNYSGEAHSKRIAEQLFTLIAEKKYTQEPIYVKEAVQAVTAIISPRERKHTNAILSRVWQALRIWTNDEFEVLQDFLNISITKLKTNGCLIVVCFHSLEDKIVTKFMRAASYPVEIDDFGNKLFNYKLITKKAIIPSSSEVEANNRSRSATLRILKKLI